jgi:hypothetical protein
VSQIIRNILCFRTVKSVWTRYSTLIRHFKVVANDTERTSKERKRFTGLFQRMESVEFLKDLSLMFDDLEELANLSLKLQ